jgi:hypothetical protein
VTFVNEYVSDDDVKKYRLTELWLRYHPEYDSYPSSFRHMWTIDREQDAYFMVMGGGGREENYSLCDLLANGARSTVRVRLAVGSSPNLLDRPFKRIWELIDIRNMNGEKYRADDETIKILKDALSVYGYFGAFEQVPNTIVEFRF